MPLAFGLVEPGVLNKILVARDCKLSVSGTSSTHPHSWHSGFQEQRFPREKVDPSGLYGLGTNVSSLLVWSASMLFKSLCNRANSSKLFCASFFAVAAMIACASLCFFR